MSAPKHTPGELLTNGHWVGECLAVHQEYVWVLPTRPVGRAKLLADGPLTFHAGTIAKATGSEAAA